MKKLIKFPLVWLIFSASTLSAQVKDQLIPLPPNSIHLSGYLEEDIQKSMENWNKGAVPYEKFVDFFRNGRPQFALGEMWGKSVRSGCMFYRYTQDPELKRIMETTVNDLLTTQRSNGSFSCVEPEKQPDGPSGDLWERKYVMLGLEEYYEWVNKDPKVLKALIRHADCIIDQVGKAPKTEITDLGWSATNIGYEPCHIESSTLLEPFMRLYKWTGHKRYLDFATYIVEAGGTKHYNVFEQAYNNVEPYHMSGHYPKAYEMTSLFEGLVEYYRATGDEKWKQTALNLYNNIRAGEITIIGNGGGDQPYHPSVMGEAWNNTALEQTNPDITRMMETCTGVTWMKFCSQILRLTGDSKAVDDIEKYIYNGLLGAMKPSGDGFSYVNLLNGEKVTNQGWGWNFDGLPVTCCNLNGPMGLAYIPYVAVMNSAAGPVVNLYNAGEINMTTPAKKPLQLNIDSDFPLSGKVVIRVNPKSREKFTLRIRIPGWSEKTSLKINGEIQAVTSGQYASLTREWTAGDWVEIEFDMTCRVIDAPHGSNPKGNYFQAVIRGPIVLARDEKIDDAYNHPVTIVADAAGVVNIAKTNPTLAATRMEFIVPTTKGDIRMVDYASVDG
ncbi:MAG: glycoside hydrolase family 127 protein, partial [Tannerella sp.]|nr:glycoside hydrolase family 127 protein [Tannerella sp.]